MQGKATIFPNLYRDTSGGNIGQVQITVKARPKKAQKWSRKMKTRLEMGGPDIGWDNSGNGVY